MGVATFRIQNEIGTSLWIPAILFYGFGDIVTTLIGLQMGLATEASPFSVLLMTEYGFGFIYVAKITTLGLFYMLWKVTPRPYRIGIPLGLSVLGVTITLWNVGILLSGL